MWIGLRLLVMQRLISEFHYLAAAFHSFEELGFLSTLLLDLFPQKICCFLTLWPHWLNLTVMAHRSRTRRASWKSVQTWV